MLGTSRNSIINLFLKSKPTEIVKQAQNLLMKFLTISLRFIKVSIICFFQIYRVKIRRGGGGAPSQHLNKAKPQGGIGDADFARLALPILLRSFSPPRQKNLNLMRVLYKPAELNNIYISNSMLKNCKGSEA